MVKKIRILSIVGIVLIVINLVLLLVEGLMYFVDYTSFLSSEILFFVISSLISNIISLGFIMYYMIWLFKYDGNHDKISILFKIVIISYIISLLFTSVQVFAFSIYFQGVIRILIGIITGLFLPAALYMWRKRDYLGTYIFLILSLTVGMITLLSNAFNTLGGMDFFWNGLLYTFVSLTFVIPDIIFVVSLGLLAYSESKETLHKVEEIYEGE